MRSNEFVQLALQLSAMLICALVFGGAMRRFKQPAVVGEMLGGIVLGPTILGVLVPAAYGWLFLSLSNVAIVRDASTKLGMLFFLFLVGLEIDLSDLRTLGRRVVLVGLLGTALPIAAGVALVHAMPRDFWGASAQRHFFSFSLFVGMNLANSANPVIARVLVDLGLLGKPIGTLIMSATLVDDLVNWTLFAIILRDIAPSTQAGGGAQAGAASLLVNGGLILLFCAFVLGAGRRLGPATLRGVRRHVAWPSSFIALTALLVLLAGSAAEALGVHAFLGAFLVGAALSGKNEELREARDAIGHFVMSFFAPLYFVSMGMSTNFIEHFDLALVSLVLVAACFSKVSAVLIGVKAAGMPLNREAWAIAFGLNARGATGIILASVGLANRLIDERMFVAMVIMALATSMMSGPVMSHLLVRRRPVVVPQLAAATD